MATELFILAGATASGKSRVAVPLAQLLQAEIIAADSMTIYRGMDIGTAKPGALERSQVPHHLLDICDPWETYSTGKFVAAAAEAIAAITARRRKCLIVGGTALYIQRLLEGIFEEPSVDWQLRRQLASCSPQFLYQRLVEVDPVAAAQIVANDLRRIVRALEIFELTGIPISQYREKYTRPAADYRPHYVGLHWERPLLYQRIEARVDSMLEQGLIAETRRLLELPYPLSRTAAQAIGYKEAIAAIHDPAQMSDLPARIKQSTRRFAKRQMTWWRRFPITWLDVSANFDETAIVAKILRLWEK